MTPRVTTVRDTTRPRLLTLVDLAATAVFAIGGAHAGVDARPRRVRPDGRRVRHRPRRRDDPRRPDRRRAARRAALGRLSRWWPSAAGDWCSCSTAPSTGSRRRSATRWMPPAGPVLRRRHGQGPRPRLAPAGGGPPRHDHGGGWWRHPRRARRRRPVRAAGRRVRTAAVVGSAVMVALSARGRPPLAGDAGRRPWSASPCGWSASGRTGELPAGHWRVTVAPRPGEAGAGATRPGRR